MNTPQTPVGWRVVCTACAHAILVSPFDNLACVARRLSSRAGRLQAGSCSKALSKQLQTPHLAVSTTRWRKRGRSGMIRIAAREAWMEQRMEPSQVERLTRRFETGQNKWRMSKPPSKPPLSWHVWGDACTAHLRRGGYRRGLDTDEVSPGSEREYRMPMARASQITIRDQLSRTEFQSTSCLVARDLTRGHTGKESGWGDQRGGES